MHGSSQVDGRSFWPESAYGTFLTVLASATPVERAFYAVRASTLMGAYSLQSALFVVIAGLCTPNEASAGTGLVDDDRSQDRRNRRTRLRRLPDGRGRPG